MPTFRRSLLFSTVAQHGSLLIGMVSMVILARLLTPEEVGLFATGASIVALIFIFVELGLHNFIVQAEPLTPERLRAAVGASVLSSLAGAVGLIAAALLVPPTIWDPRLKQVVLLGAAGLLFQPLVLPVTARLQKDLRFDVLNRVTLGRAAVMASASVLLALLGFGHLSLALGTVAEAIVGAALTLWLGRAYRPVRPALDGIGEVARFGGLWTAIGGLKQATETSVILVIGQFHGFSGTGLYNRARSIVAVCDKVLYKAVEPVMLPVLVREMRQHGSLGPHYLAKLHHLTVLVWPALGLIALFPEAVVTVVLGDAWLAAVPLVQALVLAAAFSPLTQLTFKFFTAQGRLPTYLKLVTGINLMRLVLVVALAPVSLPAAGLGLAAAQGLKAVIVSILLKRMVDCRWRQIFGRLGHSGGVALASLAVPAALAGFEPLGADAGMLHFALAALSAPAAWMMALLLFRHPMAGEIARVGRWLGARLTARLRLPPAAAREISS